MFQSIKRAVMNFLGLRKPVSLVKNLETFDAMMQHMGAAAYRADRVLYAEVVSTGAVSLVKGKHRAPAQRRSLRKLRTSIAA